MDRTRQALVFAFVFVLSSTIYLCSFTTEYTRVPLKADTIFSGNVEPMVYTLDGVDVNVWPISFSAPEELWVPVVQLKTKGFAHVVTGNEATYVFNDEDAYLQDYR